MNEDIRAARLRLERALESSRSDRWCLTLWSRLIRTRDAFRCVHCKASDGIQAHHIFRKVIYPAGRFQPGNGITLCRDCHSYLHATYNGKPKQDDPLNMKGGDDQDEVAFLYGLLVDDAIERGLDQDEHYFISDEMLELFNAWQQHDTILQSPNLSRVRKAHELWRIMPLPWYQNLADELLHILIKADVGRNA